MFFFFLKKLRRVVILTISFGLLLSYADSFKSSSSTSLLSFKHSFTHIQAMGELLFVTAKRLIYIYNVYKITSLMDNPLPMHAEHEG